MKDLVFIVVFTLFSGISFINYDRYQIVTNPVNDSPCMSDANPPYDLGTTGSHSGTTCDAVGYNDDPDADMQNVKCNSLTDDNAVWYRASYDPAYDGININITKGTIGDHVAVEVFSGGADAICDSTALFRKAKCDGLPIEDMHIGCLEDGDYIWIKVTSSDGDCGTFDISVNQINDCNVANKCSDITSDQNFYPETPPEFYLDWVCADGCLDLACSDSIDGGCDFNQNPTVWFQVNTDAQAAQLYTTITTYGYWTPIWSIWYPAPDCDNLVNAAGTGSFPCSSQSIPPDLLITGVIDIQTYYISVTADPNGEPIDDPRFEICVATIKNMVVCLGDDFGCIPDSTVVWEVTGRENTDAEPNGPPYQGPFCPGEELSVHLTFHYDATETGDDWLIGLIPKFGCGWDVDSFDYNTNAPFGNGRVAEWYDENGDCPPQMMENVGHLCTYTDEDGNLRLVNQLCETIPDGVDCSDGLEKYDTLPSGYFWVQEGASPDCDPNNCSPSRKYGIGTPIVDITWDFTMTVKEFDNSSDCLDCNDLSIVFQTFSDGAAGCWDDPVSECLIDKPQFSPNWKLDCNVAPDVIAEPIEQEICNSDNVSILVFTDDGTQDTIEVTFEDNPNISGENNYIFYEGTGMINDTLTIIDSLTCMPETVIYYFQVVKEGVTCGVNIDTIKTTVYPNPIFNIHKTDVFYGEDSTGSAIVSAFCSDSTFSYLWSTGDTLDSIYGLSEGKYIVTVTNGYGCSTVDSVRIDKISCGAANFNKTDLLCHGDCTGSIEVMDIVNGIPPFSYLWSTGDTIFMIDSLCAGLYFVTVTGADSCVSIDSIEIISPLPFNIISEFSNVKCYGECNGAILINDIENAVKPLSYLWDSGDTTNHRINICAGNYFVTVTDSIGCSNVYTFVIDQPDEIKITIDSIRDIRATPLGYIAITGKENYIYHWTGPDGFKSDKKSIFGLDKAGCYSLTVTDTLSDCIADTTICISDKTWIIDENNDFNIYIYPNPADDVVYFDLKENSISQADIRIYNISGVEVNRFKINSGDAIYKFNSGKMTQGLYIFKILSEKGVKVGTFIISR